MRRLMLAAIVVLASRGLVWAADEEDSVATLPPVVVKTVPQAGDTKVKPSITQIRVTFSKKMTERKLVLGHGRRAWMTRQATLSCRRQDLRDAGQIGAGKDLRGVAQFAEVPQFQGCRRAAVDPLPARLRDEAVGNAA